MHGRHIACAVAMAILGNREVTLAAPREPASAAETLPPEPGPNASPLGEDRVGGANAFGPDVPYDRVLQKSIHNAYARDEPIVDQLVYHRIRSLELDIHTRRAGAAAAPGTWFVYHEDVPFMGDTSCERLGDCLAQVAAFHRALPRHEVVTLFLDLKDDFDHGHSPADLDRALADALGIENILRPGDLLGTCPGAAHVRDAVTGDCQFPSLRALRGKFIVATTGGTACDAKSPVARYLGHAPVERLAFAAPNAHAACPVETYDALPDIVFFNLPLSERARAREVERRGLVARIYGGGTEGGLDDASDFALARMSGATHLATDKVSAEASAWSSSQRGRGFPFTCLGCSDAATESGAVLGVRAQSGDQYGARDSAMLAYEHGDGPATWTSLVAVPSSHVEPFAKGCLVARESLDPDAASVAICRPFDTHAPRAQLRARRGEETKTILASSVDGLSPESLAYLRLAIAPGPGRSDVALSVSPDGRVWSAVLKTTVRALLPIRGVSVSSHGRAPVKALFAGLVSEERGSARVVSANDLAPRALGPGTQGEVFDGTVPRRSF
jgi:hypothetical protein